ncbi:hypothetical protein A9Q83_07510 [Alphaproteobacteria bacterium 46_93_T64]|nr:hypothetical protein A9Q83_07510 [Alphaproteobacteria bacterium 46_93_T64]
MINGNTATPTLKTWRSAVLLASFVTLFLFIVSSYILNGVATSIGESANNRYQSYLLADELRQSSDDLTRMVRTYAATRNEIFKNQFQEVLAIRNGEQPRPKNYNQIYWDFFAAHDRSVDRERAQPLRQMMIKQGITKEELALLQEAQDRSDALVALENMAMRAIKGNLKEADEQHRVENESNRDMALRILHGPEYHRSKASIMDPIQRFFVKLDTRTAIQVQEKIIQSNRLIALIVSLIVLESALVVIFVYLSRYISQREQSTLANKNRELDFQKLSLDEHAIVSIVDAERHITHVNDKYCDISGYTRNELIGNEHHVFFSEEQTPEFYNNIWKTMANGSVWRGEIENISKTGAHYWVNATIIPFADASGKPFQYIALRTDITERKRIEADLRLSEGKLDHLVQSQTDFICRFLPNGIFSFINKSYADSIGKDQSELIGTSLYDNVPRNEHKKIKDNLLHLSQDAPTFTTVNQTKYGIGGTRTFEWINHAYFDDDGNITEIQATGRDVTDFHLALARAEAANIAKSEFLSTMSHEIRTPLNGVLGLAQLLKHTHLDEDQHQKVDIILSSGQTLLSIISDVLDMSKIEAGKLELEEKAFSLNDLISTITSPFQSLADDKGLKLVVSDSSIADLAVVGDPVRLRQILWNLLSNAIKFTEAGQITLTIETAEDVGDTRGLMQDAKEHLIHMSVEDTGIGISQDRLDVIFESFTQEDSSTTRKYGGTGLGLTIVEQLTELMGGTIKVDSEIGAGTKFNLHIPFEAAINENVNDVSVGRKETAFQEITSINVILAEDNDVNAMIAKAFLEKFGHSVKHVKNGKLAVEAAKEDWADLILMDIHMPEMNGIEAAREIRKTAIGKNISIVGLTAEAFAERHAQFKEAGINDVLTKPFTEKQLADILAANRQWKPQHV